MGVCDMSNSLKNSQTISASKVIAFPVFLWTYSYLYHCALKLYDSFQVKLYNYNGNPRVLSFTSFPLHVGIVSLSCCWVPPWYTRSLHPCKMLQKHIFKTITGAAFGDVCLRECYRDVTCQSFNYVFTQDKCELSNRTKEAKPQDFVPNSERYYFRKDMKRGER